MSDTLYNKFCSVKNLSKALSRLKTSQNIFYKNYYRDIIEAYEMNENENLLNLSKRLKGFSYAPSEATRIYLPKFSGLHRPITFLYLDDLIVYQGIANIIKDKISNKRQKVEGSIVFSNIFNRDKKTPYFFYNKWQIGYNGYINKIKQVFREGNNWFAHFDLASYYDTISHELLKSTISNRGFDDFKTLLIDCLKQWSTPKKQKYNHGIPQGPIASDLIGELYLLPIDLFLFKNQVKFLRYVDDIKIYGKTREEVLNGIILLEKECKERGLIPQPKKYEIINAKKEKEAIGKNPSLSIKEKKTISVDKNESLKIFIKSFDLDPNFHDPSKTKFILSKSPPNKGILTIVLENMNSRPEYCREYCMFLRHYGNSRECGAQIFNNSLATPSQYDFVEGNYWWLLSLFNLKPQHKYKYINVAMQRLKHLAKDKKGKIALKIGLYKFLSSTNNNHVIKWLENEPNQFIQMIISSHINLNCNPSCNKNNCELIQFINKLLNRSRYEPALICIYKLLFGFNFNCLKKIDTPKKDLSQVLAKILYNKANVDPIGQILNRKYNIKSSSKWKKLLTTQYNHANKILALANSLFENNPSNWVTFLDAFNDIIVRSFISLLNKTHPDVLWPKTLTAKHKIIDYGVLLDANNQLSKSYPQIINGFRILHNRRNNIPSSHPYDKKTGKKCTIVRPNEQNYLVRELVASYNELVKAIETFL